MAKQECKIGIDPGVKTGIAIKIGDKVTINTVKIHHAFMIILNLSNDYDISVICEDARYRKWFGQNAILKQQGAGAIKIQSKIWSEFLEDMKKTGRIKKYKMVSPVKGATKLDDVMFKKITGYHGKTSNHGRDAYMLLYISI